MKKLKRRLCLIAMGLFLLSLSGCGKGGRDLSDWAYIQDKGEMVIGITYFEPMNYLDESDQLTGFETEFATAVCEILGVKPVFQEINWSAKETELKAKTIDCIWNGMTIDGDREANMSISKAYMSNQQVLVVKAENASDYKGDLSGRQVVAEAGSAGESVCGREDFFADAVYTAVDTQAKALMEVTAGTADAAVVDYVMSVGMIGPGTDYEALTVVLDRAFGEERYGVALRKEDSQLTQKINEAMTALGASGKLAEIAEAYQLDPLLLF